MPADQSELEGDFSVPVWDHLEELRERVLVAGLATLAAICACFCVSKDLVVFLEAPVAEQGVRFLQLSPGEFFFTTLKVTHADTCVLHCLSLCSGQCPLHLQGSNVKVLPLLGCTAATLALSQLQCTMLRRTVCCHSWPLRMLCCFLKLPDESLQPCTFVSMGLASSIACTVALFTYRCQGMLVFCWPCPLCCTKLLHTWCPA